MSRTSGPSGAGADATARTGVLRGSSAVAARKALDDSESLLRAADGLVEAADATGIEAKVAAATALIAQVEALTSGKAN